MGNTIRKEMKTDRLREENQNSANITKDATGVVFITDTSGAISSRNLVYLAAPTAANIPSRAANPKPPKILHAEKAMLLQKDGSGKRVKRRILTATGDTKSISCPRHMLPICQITSQKRIAHIFIEPLRTMIVETIFRQCAA